MFQTAFNLGITRLSVSSLLLLVDCFEVDRSKQYRREAGAGYAVGNGFACVREQDVRTSNAQQQLYVFFRNIFQTEDAALGNFVQEHGALFVQFGSYGNVTSTL